MNCHFVYSVPSSNSFLNKSIRKGRGIFNRLGLPIPLLSKRHPDDDDFTKWPTKSPYENTKHIYKALAAKAPTLLYHLSEKVKINFESDDVFLGHPYFPHQEGNYGVTEIATLSKIRPRVFAIITPLHCNVEVKTSHINKEFLDDVDRLMPKTDKLFAIMGEYWWDAWDKSPYAHWKQKMIRLDMAVDTAHFLRVKKQFNKPGSRGYLFIGGSWDPRKGIEYFARLMAELGECRCGWIGDGPEINGLTRISRSRNLTTEYMSIIANDFDFFVSPAIADPNPTTILESMAWGFPVICTPQSGYYETEYRRNIFIDNFQKSVDALKDLQYAEEAVLYKMADSAREVVADNYNWDKFTAKIIENLDLR